MAFGKSKTLAEIWVFVGFTYGCVQVCLSYSDLQTGLGNFYFTVKIRILKDLIRCFNLGQIIIEIDAHAFEIIEGDGDVLGIELYRIGEGGQSIYDTMY